MLRAGYGAGTMDPQFKRNVANCELHGIHWGCYWYSYAASPAEARQEARACLDVIKGLRPTMPVAYDIEYEPCILALDNGTRTEMVQAFLGEIEAVLLHPVRQPGFYRQPSQLARAGAVRRLVRPV